MKIGISKLFSYNNIVSYLSVLYAGLVFYFVTTMFESPRRFCILFVAFSLIIMIVFSMKRKKIFPLKQPYYNILATVFILACIVWGIYFYVESDDLISVRAGMNTPIDYFLAVIAIYLVIQLVWTEFGKPLPIFVIIMFGYCYFGNYIPGFFHHGGISLSRILGFSALTIDGIFGTLSQLATTWIVLFVFFAGFIQGFGGLEFLVGLCAAVLGRFRAGIPQIAVLSSMIFGMFSGSAAANTAGTGTFTIPLMKKCNIPAPVAGAIEATASAGGQVMPPVMGLSAFVMCDFLGKPYREIMIIGFAPAILYYIFVAVSVHFLAVKYVILPNEVILKKEKITPTYLAQGIPIIVGICVLVYYVIMGSHVMVAGFRAIVAFVILRLVYDLIVGRGKPSVWANFAKNLMNGVRSGAEQMVPIVATCAILGLVIGVLAVTGLSMKLTFGMVDLAGGSLTLLVLLVFGVCVLFGMAMTTVGAYVLVVILAAPAMLKFGISPIVSHFTVFYFALLSLVTPPVAGTVMIAAPLAKASYFRTAWEACKLSLPIAILPFVFIPHPELISGKLDAIPWMLYTCIGLLSLSFGIFFSTKGVLGYVLKPLAIILGGISLFYPTGGITYACLGGSALLIAIFILKWGAGIPLWESSVTCDKGKSEVGSPRT